MNKLERITMVKAMEFIARNIIDEAIFETWLTYGVADDDIRYGDVAPAISDDLDSYVEDDESFADLMLTFLTVMKEACEDGGLYCDKVTSGHNSSKDGRLKKRVSVPKIPCTTRVSANTHSALSRTQ